MARSFAQVFQSMDRAEQLEDLYVTSVKVIIVIYEKNNFIHLLSITRTKTSG